MKLTLSRPSDRTTAQWAGGTTTQLAIHPPKAEYTKFNFLFRLSTATIEVPESTFTFMPGVTRHLMILDGALDIDHKGRYKKHLPQYGYDVFDGEWPTTAKARLNTEGKVVDFNLMVREKATGKLQAIAMRARQEETFVFRPDVNYTGFYLLEGKIRLIAGSHSADLNAGDFLLCGHEGEEQIIHVQATAATHMVLATVQM